MSLIAIMGAISASFLPETLRQHLPETIEDAENFGKGNKYWSLHPDNDEKNRKSIKQNEIQQTAVKSPPLPHSSQYESKF